MAFEKMVILTISVSAWYDAIALFTIGYNILFNSGDSCGFLPITVGLTTKPSNGWLQ